MIIEFRAPLPEEEHQLRLLFTEAFGDADFTSLFFSTGYSPTRCLAAAENSILAALHWFDCSLDGKRAAYLYGIAAFEAHRGRGIGSALIRAALDHLGRLGYESIFLVPAVDSLFPYYGRFGFRTVGTLSRNVISAGAPLPIRKLSVAEYAGLRRACLPARALIQEGPCLDLFAGYADFYAAPNAVAAVSGSMVWELLGDESDAPGLIAALGLPSATVRTPGTGSPFAMAIGVEGTVYLGLALD